MILTNGLDGIHTKKKQLRRELDDLSVSSPNLKPCGDDVHSGASSASGMINDALRSWLHGLRLFCCSDWRPMLPNYITDLPLESQIRIGGYEKVLLSELRNHQGRTERYPGKNRAKFLWNALGKTSAPRRMVMFRVNPCHNSTPFPSSTRT